MLPIPMILGSLSLELEIALIVFAILAKIYHIGLYLSV